MGQAPLVGEGAAKFYEFKAGAQGVINSIVVGYLILVVLQLS